MPLLSDLPRSLITGFAVALGLVFGSFLNVVIYRLPRGESIVTPGSRCPSCGKRIRAWDNLPVLSFLLLRGKSRCCNVGIPFRYPLVEVVGGLWAWALVEMVVLDLPGETPWWRAVAVFAAYLALGLGLIAVAFIDLAHMLVPDEITIGGTVVGLASVPLRPGADLVDSLAGAFGGFTLIWILFVVGYRALRGQAGMGLGDAKLLMLAGAWFGWKGAVFTLLAGAVQGTLVALAVFVAKGRIDEPDAVVQERRELREEIERAEGEERRSLEGEMSKDPLAAEPGQGLAKARIAFGPFLALATLEYTLFGEILTGETATWWLGPSP